jgi:hypothetical protein
VIYYIKILDLRIFTTLSTENHPKTDIARKTKQTTDDRYKSISSEAMTIGKYTEVVSFARKNRA